VQFSVPDDGFLSRNHFLIEFNPPVCFLRDLGSTNGTKVNGVRIEAARLRDGDLISAGESSFVIRVEESWSESPNIRCMGCGMPAPRDIAISAMPGDGAIDWLCESCIAHRRQYPTPPPDYWIEKRIGGGGMGEVFLARHLPSNRPVAIKMMIPTVAASDRAKAYFRRELEVVKNLRHPNIVAFHGMVEMEGQFQLVMEYVDGKNAREWVSALTERMTINTAARLGVQLLSALEHAHEKGYVHRDIKPSNLLVMGPPNRPKLKLSDFGLAKSFRDNAGFAGLTHQGDVGGSVGFLSPDHIRDFREVKEPADIYSTGATLYYLLTGTFPFLDFDPNRGDAYTMILEHPSVPLRAHRPDAPEGFDAILRKALEKQARERWKSASAMAKALMPYIEGPL
jgi:serine/threonine-protein kinase